MIMKQSHIFGLLIIFIALVMAVLSCRQIMLPKLLFDLHENYDRQSFSQNGQSVVFGSTSNKYVIYVRDIEDPASTVKIYLPFDQEGNNGYFEELCLADEIWMTTPVGQIASYDTNAGTWTIHPRMNSRKRTFCQALSDNGMIIFSDNQIAIFQDGWQYYELPEDVLISGVARNSHSQIFAIDLMGQLFILENGSWQELPLGLGELKIGFHCLGISADNVLWIVGREGSVFAWDPSTNTAPRKFVLEFGQEQYEFVTDFFIGPRGQIWIFATDGIWLIDNYQLQRITFPRGNPLNPYIEPTKERMYFDFGGISYYDLDDLIGK